MSAPVILLSLNHRRCVGVVIVLIIILLFILSVFSYLIKRKSMYRKGNYSSKSSKYNTPTVEHGIAENTSSWLNTLTGGSTNKYLHNTKDTKPLPSTLLDESALSDRPPNVIDEHYLAQMSQKPHRQITHTKQQPKTETLPKSFLHNSSTYTLKSQPIPKKYPPVSIATKKLLLDVGLDNFVWLEKTDGLNQIIILYDDAVYHIHNQTVELIPELNIQQDKLCIFMTELYNNKYYIFDAHTVDGIDISQSFYKERMKAVADWIKPHHKDLFQLKDFKNIDSIKQLLDVLKLEKSPETNCYIDGVICQQCNKPFNEVSAYKLKNPVMNTTDFRLMWNPQTKSYDMYLSATPTDYFRSPRLYTRRCPIYDPNTHEKIIINKSEQLPQKIEIAFATPYNEFYQLRPRKVWRQDGYFPHTIDEINRLMERFTHINAYKTFHGKIVECSLAVDGWVPVRIRDDKLSPNRWDVGMTNMGVQFAPLTDDESYFSVKQVTPQNICDVYHNVNRIIRKCIFEDLLHKNHEYLSVLDLAGGRGGDELYLYNYGTRNLFATDLDKEALMQYVNRTPKMYNIKYESLLYKSLVKKRSTMSLNVFETNLGSDNEKYVYEIKHRKEYPPDGFDLIVMNYAVHYLCYDEKVMDALNMMVKELIAPDGLFMFSYFDGDAILNDMNNGVLDLGECFRIELLDNNEDDSENAVRAKMPLPTISSSGYREEPLATSVMLNRLHDGFKIIDMYAPYDKFAKKVDSEKDYDKVEKFLKYIRVCIMQNDD